MENNILQKQLVSGKISHAYLLIGNDLKAKNKALNGFINALFKESFPELIKIVPSKNKILINQIKEIKHFLRYKSTESSWRVAIIEDAHLLNQQAANALLKELEEPGERQILILLANTTAKIPKTVLSRCQILKFITSVSDICENKEYQEWLKFFSLTKMADKIFFLDAKLAKKTPKQLSEIIDIWIDIMRKQLKSGSSVRLAKNIMKITNIKQITNNPNIKMQMENLIINF